ncbi:protease [Bdellovibrio svalbardensis]|uniref:Protease n=1 Tax=Bdellovibrio svalbardensis TaxID=2972972 RepID=A0ABT6DG26_9BACT|nr:protease [Bdellovibrio svalbardensis]MDG0814894.1 protease [Bdellovibrio svalbardensis]
MKLKSLMAILAALCVNSTAFADEFDGGSGEFDPKPLPNYTEAEIQKKIAQEMEIACSGNLCRIVGTDSSGEGWTVSFNVGYGNGNGNSGTSIYIGDKYNNNPNDTTWNAGITVTYKNYHCQSNLRVTPAVYRFVNTYMYNMVNSDGSTKRNFSPADQTVILFYTTMLNKVDSCANAAK